MDRAQIRNEGIGVELINVDRTPGKRLVTDRLQAQRIGAPAGQPAKPSGSVAAVIAEAERITREAAKA